MNPKAAELTASQLLLPLRQSVYADFTQHIIDDRLERDILRRLGDVVVDVLGPHTIRQEAGKRSCEARQVINDGEYPAIDRTASNFVGLCSFLGEYVVVIDPIRRPKMIRPSLQQREHDRTKKGFGAMAGA